MTGRSFGAPLEDSRASHAFLPSAGARHFSELPTFASAYLAALEGVYLASASPAAPVPSSPERLESSPSSSRAPTPAAITENSPVVEVLAPSDAPPRTGSEGDETIVEDAMMADAV